MAVENGNGDEVHICDDVIQTERHESEGGPPDGNDLGGDLAGGDGDEDGEADEPVGADGAEEDLVPGRGEHFHGGEVEDLGAVGGDFEDAAVWKQQARVRSPRTRAQASRHCGNSHPVMMAMKKSIPARFPTKEMAQLIKRSLIPTRRCRNAVNMNCFPISQPLPPQPSHSLPDEHKP